MDGYPKRYIVLDPHQVSVRSLDPRADALAPYPPSTQVSCVTLRGEGPLGPRDPSLMSPAYVRVSSVAPNPASLRSGIEALRYRVDGYPKRYIVLDPFYSSRSVPNDLT